MRPQSPNRNVRITGDWDTDHSEYRTRVVDQSNVYGELAVAINKLFCSIQWIYKPEEIARRFGAKNPFLTDNRKTRPLLKGLFYQSCCTEISLRDRRAIVFTPGRELFSAVYLHDGQ
jgi:hypothetical protein